ncbi:MAG: dihydropteroate synthase [Bacillales bacterium]|jgi:dihydropteroate synthase|nr:dihydropteroate synthase [Bacillales bacterium]
MVSVTSLEERFINAGEFRLNLENGTIIMGILNVTPDSFSDGGLYTNNEDALKKAKSLIDDGAQIIDIGGESTRPGSKMLSVEEEIKRVIPIIKHISKDINVPISIDTYKAKVAELACESGASIINDVWGAKYEPDIAKVAAHYNVPIVLMHNREDRNYKNFVNDVIDDLKESISIAKNNGVKEESIILDPGIGFAKTPDQNIILLQNIKEIKKLGYPVLLGTSRKSFIGLILDLPVNERAEGTISTVCYGILNNIEIMRVHDVKEVSRAAKVMDVLTGKRGFVNG